MMIARVAISVDLRMKCEEIPVTGARNRTAMLYKVYNGDSGDN